MASKRQNQKLHAQRRSLERYGFIIDIDAAIKDIQEGRAKFVERQSLRVTAWKVTQQNKDLVVIYDKSRKMIVTVLPENSFDPFYTQEPLYVD